MRQVQYTFDWYRDLLATLDERGRRFRTYDQTVTEGDVLLRHDVDLSPAKALETARIEADEGVRATYFFLCSTPMYNPVTGRLRRIVRRIEDLGHDVGLHFSTHQYWDVDDDGAPPLPRPGRLRVFRCHSRRRRLPHPSR